MPDGVDIYEFAAEPAAQYTTLDGQAHQGEYLPGGDFALWCQEAGAYGYPSSGIRATAQFCSGEWRPPA